MLPLLLVHGWPGSVVEFFDIIPLLVEGNAKVLGKVHKKYSLLGKLSFKKNGKERGHCPYRGEGGQPQFLF